METKFISLRLRKAWENDLKAANLRSIFNSHDTVPNSCGRNRNTTQRIQSITIHLSCMATTVFWSYPSPTRICFHRYWWPGCVQDRRTRDAQSAHHFRTNFLWDEHGRRSCATQNIGTTYKLNRIESILI